MSSWIEEYMNLAAKSRRPTVKASAVLEGVSSGMRLREPYLVPSFLDPFQKPPVRDIH